MAIETESDFLKLTAQIVAAYVSRNNAAITDLPAVIASVGRALRPCL